MERGSVSIGDVINWKELVISDLLGSGAYGNVYRAKCKNIDVVVKTKKHQVMTEETRNSFIREVKAMSQLRHPNICLYIGVCNEWDKFSIIQEYMKGGDLEKTLNESPGISLYKRMQMGFEAACGIEWLHRCDFIHRDIKPKNLLIDSHGTIKVSDFGISLHLPSNKPVRGVTGTWEYMAPEVMIGKFYDKKADVYSFGIVLWQLLTRMGPFSHYHRNRDALKHAVYFENERPAIPEGTEPSLVKLITDCWNPNPKLRPTASEVTQSLKFVLVDVAVSDPIGRNLWKTHFLGQKEVKWNDFTPKLISTLNLPNCKDPEERLKLQCLKAVLTIQQPVPHFENVFEDVVTLQNWGKTLMWFGPISPASNTPNSFLSDLKQLLSYKWFHGEITSQRVIELLTNKPLGTFLVRLSSQEGYFTISQLGTGEIHHLRISHSPGHGYKLENENIVYPTLAALVAEKMKGLESCGGSKFSTLFKTISSGY
uniref:Non-specific protein-tyrosine kinase n=1 Tax=Arcella intermedia TaxID=1963864 RepID=A0A6B2L2Y9_9EUKA